MNERNEQRDLDVPAGTSKRQALQNDIALGGVGNGGYDTSAENGYRRRSVVSFVRRNGHMDDRLKRAWSRYASDYLLDIGDEDANALDVRQDFRFTKEFVHLEWGNGHPLIVEIGTGQGENIVAAAQARPQTNFLAVEVYDPGVAHTMLLAGKAGLANLRIAQVNAPELVDAAEAGVASEVWTFFPDPWPKMRHHKRRIVQPALAEGVHTMLEPNGLWRLATDIEDYALHVHEVMDSRSDFDNTGNLAVSLPTEHVGKGTSGEAAAMPHADFLESERFEGRVLTNFEAKGLDAGRTIHDFVYRAQ